MKGMFLITCFVKDSKLAEVKRLLDGRVYDLKDVPCKVAGETASKQKHQQQTKRPAEKREKAKKLLRAMQGQFRWAEMVHKAEKHGISKSVVLNALTDLTNEGEIVKVQTGTYELQNGRS